MSGTLGLRVTEEEEVVGLDKLEHGLTSAYADFAKASTVRKLKTEAEKVSVDKAVPVQLVSKSAPTTPQTQRGKQKESLFAGTPSGYTWLSTLPGTTRM